MTSVRTIQCTDCGADYDTTRSNTKYCQVCRIYRSCNWIGKRQYTCLECDRRFAPLERGDLLCGTCDFFLRKPVEGSCALCGNTSDRLLHATISVCGPCAKDPEQRRTFLRALAKKRRANGD